MQRILQGAARSALAAREYSLLVFARSAAYVVNTNVHQEKITGNQQVFSFAHHLSANAVSTAQCNKDEASALMTDSTHRSVVNLNDFFAKLLKIITDVLKTILEDLREVYKVLRTSVIAEINLMLKYLNVEFDLEVWLDSIEKALFDCGRVRQQDVIDDAKVLYNDVLLCLRANVDRLEEIKARALLALDILGKASPYFRKRYELCHNKTDEEPSEPSQHGILDAKSLNGLTCLASAMRDTAIFLKPVPGHLYTFAKLLVNISTNKQKEVVKCFAEKSVKHFKFVKETAKSFAICVAFS